MRRNVIKCKYMFMLPLKNLARKGLIWCQPVDFLQDAHSRQPTACLCVFCEFTLSVPGPLFTKKTPSYQYRDSHYKPETAVRSS